MRFIIVCSDCVYGSSAAAAHREFIRSLDLIELEQRKVKKARTICEAEIGEYTDLGSEIEENIMQTRQEIEMLKKELAKEKLIRQRKEECESLAKVVTAVQSREETSKQLNELQSELQQKQKAQKQTSKELELRKKQFSLLMQSIQALKPALAEEDDAQEDEEEEGELAG